MKFYFDPLDKKCKSVTGAIARGREITLNVYSDGNGSCELYLNKDGCAACRYEMKKTNFGWQIVLKINETGLYFYHFIYNGIYYGCGRLRLASTNAEASFQITVYDEKFTTPDWFKGGVMYQIFPDRFAKKGEYPIDNGKILRSDWGATPEFRPDKNGIVKNNDFFGGNFNGIISKLDYLQSLSVTTIYLNPIFEASSNHRYDTGDYKKIDSLLGTKEDFEKLVKEAKKREIHIVLDAVLNHTGDNSVYFNRYGHYKSIGAYQNVNSEYYDWYNFYDYPNGYECWWGILTLPAVNEKSIGYQNFIFGENGVLKYWLKTGIDGYRLDVADELPDFFLKKLRKAVKESNPNALIIGEVWEDASNKISYGQRREYFQGAELDSVMNYPLKDSIIDYVLTGNCERLAETIKMLRDNYPKSVLDCLMNILSTHDTCRILTVFGEKIIHDKEEMAITELNEEKRAQAIEKLKVAAVLQYTLPGIPCVYYGDENAMEGYIDPFCRRCFDWNHLNTNLIDFYRKLGTIRKRLKNIFSDGEFFQIYAEKNLFIYARVNEHEKCYIYVNNGMGKSGLKLNGSFEELLSGEEYSKNIDILPYSYGILVRKS